MVETKRKVYTGIDLFKLIAAILVVILHAIETTSWYPNEIKFVITRVAVPFFFISSGFFFYKGLEKAEDIHDYFVKYEKNILRMFLVWALIIYSPFEVISYTNKYPGAGVLKTALYLVRRIFIIGPGPYWYLVALIGASCFLYACYKKENEKLLLVGMAVGFILEIAYSCFRGILSNVELFRLIFNAIYFVYSWEFNFFMFGIPFMGIGFLVARHNKSLKSNYAFLLLILSTMMRIVEYNLPVWFPSTFWRNNEISLFFILQAYAFFMLGKDIQLGINYNTSKLLRELSSCIYFLHAIVLYELMNPLLERYTELPIYSGVMIFPKVVVVVLICSMVFIAIRKIDNKYLNVLING
ncbi:MAG: acyltransferase [Eubacterium sp.]|nr:acyltransferase [Eubacterium sp.]